MWHCPPSGGMYVEIESDASGTPTSAGSPIDGSTGVASTVVMLGLPIV